MPGPEQAASLPAPHFHLEVWALVVGLSLAYVLAITYLGPRRAPPGAPPATGGQKIAFFLGVLSLWAGEEWPLHELAEDYLFSAHMVQHLLFAFVAPPLLLVGTPPWLLRSLIGRGTRFRVVRFLTRPIPALLLFNAAIAAMHWSTVVNLQVQSDAFHVAFHGVLIGAGLLMWAVVIAPLPELRRLAEPARMFYLFLQSVVPTVPASFLTFSSGVLYTAYAEAPRMWGIDAVTDQRMAGLIMKLGGGLLLWSVITYMFFKWNAKEEAQREEEVTWDDFERELEVWDMRK
ncbi:MAG: cytochrome c oxidase assembly protein [Actinomycetota bacterium]